MRIAAVVNVRTKRTIAAVSDSVKRPDNRMATDWCDDCAISTDERGCVGSASTHATGSVKRHGRKEWVWHVCSLTRRYKVSGVERTKHDALARLNEVFGIAAEASGWRSSAQTRDSE